MSAFLIEKLTRRELTEILKHIVDTETGLSSFEKNFCMSIISHIEKRNPTSKQISVLQRIFMKFPDAAGKSLKRSDIGGGVMDAPIKASSGSKKKLDKEMIIKKDCIWNLYTDLFGAVEKLSDRDTLSQLAEDFALGDIEKAFIEAEQQEKGFRWMVSRLYYTRKEKKYNGSRKKNFKKSGKRYPQKSSYYGQFFTKL